MREKILVIGLDGSRLDLIKKWADKGLMPNTKKLIENGSSGILKTVFPPQSMSAWTSLVTGLNPGKHGIFATELPQENSYTQQVPNSTSIHGQKIYETLSNEGKKIAIINLPLSYPPTQVNGIMITGFLTPPMADCTYPKELSKKLQEIGYTTHTKYATKEHADFFDETFKTAQKRFDISKWFMENNNWDFVMLIIGETEHMHHNYSSFLDKKHPKYNPKSESEIKKFYKKIDSEMGKIIRLAKDATVFVVSDHGFAPQYGTVYLNNVFEKNNLFKAKKNLDFLAWMVSIVKRFGWRARLQKALDRTGLKMPKKVEEKLREKAFENVSADWSRTKVFCTGKYGEIKINLAGREPQGIVEKKDYEKIRDKVIHTLKNDSETGKLVKNVYRREELFSGPFLDKIPDLYVEFKKPHVTSVLTPKNKFFEKTGAIEGFHTMDATFIASGKNIKKQTIKGANITDVAPTILSIFGIPAEMDGGILNIFKNKNIVKKKAGISEKIKTKRKRKKLTEKQEIEIRKKLEEMGYIDVM